MLLDRIEERDAFGNVGTTRTQLQIRCLQSDDERTRLIAASNLVNIGEAAVESLINALRERHEHVWTLAASVLVKIGEPAVNLLVEALYDQDEQVRILAVGVLGRIGSTRAVQPLIHAIRQEQEQVRTLMIWALVKIGTPAVGPLIVALRDNAPSVQAAAADALGEIRDPRATTPLRTVQKTASAEVRQVIEEALTKFDNAPDTLPARQG